MDGVEAPMATMSLTTTAPAASLLGLPTELRLKIYEHLLPTARTSKPLVWYSSTHRWVRAQPKGYSELAAIARVCRVFATKPGRLVFAKAALRFHYLETLYFQSRASRAIFSALMGNQPP
ncbi:hypothetical protein B0A48_00665 [Cryoendolithus antarcticus]|uniref:Uncharacterized protein n=1 Tax=Cryoendolithus antarcticus TaxID=1507870 RepID=A0A1V8TVS8_9PEZI|nr:hypothetical protein B0A48_00665 [Cryoendolithus antarcticus]